MIKKNRLSLFAQSVAALGLVTGIAACDDEKKDNPDANNNGDPDACQGHVCPGYLTGLPEGGEFRYELFQVGYDADTGEHQEILGGWFMAFSGQAQQHDILGPPVPGVPGCFDQTAGNYYMSGKDPVRQAAANTRTYYNVGDEVTTQGPESSFTMTRQQNTEDPSQLIQHGYIYMTDTNGASELERGVKYSLPTVAPSGDFPGLDLKNPGFSMAAQEQWADTSLAFPHDFTLISPSEEEYFAEGGLSINPAEDFVITYDAPDAPANWPGQLQFTGILNNERKFVYLCLGEENGTFTIGKGLFEQDSFPQQGLIIHGTITHDIFAQNYSGQDHRFDVLGVNCKFSSYSLTDAE